MKSNCPLKTMTMGTGERWCHTVKYPCGSVKEVFSDTRHLKLESFSLHKLLKSVRTYPDKPYLAFEYEANFTRTIIKDENGFSKEPSRGNVYDDTGKLLLRGFMPAKMMGALAYPLRGQQISYRGQVCTVDKVAVSMKLDEGVNVNCTIQCTIKL